MGCDMGLAPIYIGEAWVAHQGHGGYGAAVDFQHVMESRPYTNARKGIALTCGANLTMREERGAWAMRRGS